MKYGFDEATKEKVEMYSKSEVHSFGTSYSWNINFLFDYAIELLNCRSSMTLVTLEEGTVVTQVPANDVVIGRIELPAYFAEKYSTVEEVFDAITLNFNSNGVSSAKVRIADYSPFSPVYKIQNTYYLQFVVWNETDVAQDSPILDIIMIVNNSTTPPTPPV